MDRTIPAIAAACALSFALGWLAANVMEAPPTETAQREPSALPAIEEGIPGAPAAPESAAQPPAPAREGASLEAQAEEEELSPTEAIERAHDMLEQMPEVKAITELETSVKADPERALQIVQELVKALDPLGGLGTMEYGERAILALAKVDSRIVEPTLYAYAESGVPWMAAPAVRALEMRGDPRPIQTYIAALTPGLSSANPAERVDAVVALGRTKSTRVLPQLRSASFDPSTAVRLKVAQSLYSIRTDEAQSVMRRMMNDPNPRVAAAASKAYDRASPQIPGARN